MSRDELAAVRAWAFSRGIHVETRGRLPVAVLELWQAAQADPAVVAATALEDSVVRVWAAARGVRLDDNRPVPEPVVRHFDVVRPSRMTGIDKREGPDAFVLRDQAHALPVHRS